MSKCYLCITFPGIPDIVCSTTKDECDRLQSVLADIIHPTFFWFRSINNRDLVINLNALQVVRFMTTLKGIEFKPKDVQDQDIIISLKNNERPIIAFSESSEQLFGFFQDMASESSAAKYLGFVDEDGSLLRINTQEILITSAPSHLINEGRRKTLEHAIA